MATDVSWILELGVQPAREKDLRALMDEMVSGAKAETGTLNFEWSATADRSVWQIFERYADSAAVMIHLAAFGTKFAARFQELCKPLHCVVCGSASPEVKKALAGLHPIYMESVGGFSR
jgi:quinol monooxygenase YgiN